MIYINNLSISNDRTNINVNVETNIGANITKILLWNENTFKDYTKAIDISFKLEQVNNKEIFTLLNTDINIGQFQGIYFLEITSDYDDEDDCVNCQNTIIGIAANLNHIKTYLLNKVLELQVCKNCDNDTNDIINIHLTTKTICTALSLGYYDEAIFLYKKLKKLIGPKLECNNCRELRTPVFINSLNFATLDNSIILI